MKKLVLLLLLILSLIYNPVEAQSNPDFRTRMSYPEYRGATMIETAGFVLVFILPNAVYWTIPNDTDLAKTPNMYIGIVMQVGGGFILFFGGKKRKDFVELKKWKLKTSEPIPYYF